VFSRCAMVCKHRMDGCVSQRWAGWWPYGARILAGLG
jgi:hypothetical protein